MTNRYSRTGTALADGISGTRVMQPANNAVIQAPALPRLSRSNCSADKKAPLEIRRPFLPQTEPGQMPHFSSREGCLLGYRSDLIITGCGNGSGCITERSKGMYFIAPF